MKLAAAEAHAIEMAISEKVYELNITHEILSSAEYLWALLDSLLGGRSGSPRRSPGIAIGLTLRDELHKGWDVRIELPPWMSAARCIFLQFKAPTHCGFTRRSKSAFRGNWKSPKAHCRFGINNNGTQDQHVILRGLSKDPSNHGAVLYALPRLTTPGALKHWAGRMALMTSFLDVDDVEQMAAAKGMQIVRGRSHELRIAYGDRPREIHSTVIDASSAPSRAAEVIAEIHVVRAWRALADWASAAREHGNAETLQTVIESHIAHVNRYWGTPFHVGVADLSSFVALYSTVLADSAHDYSDIIAAVDKAGEAVVARTTARLQQLFQSARDVEWPYEVPPEPTSEGSVRLTSDSELRIAAEPDISPAHVDWAAVSYTLF